MTDLSDDQECCVIIACSLWLLVLLVLYIIYFYSAFNWEMLP